MAAANPSTSSFIGTSTNKEVRGFEPLTSTSNRPSRRPGTLQRQGDRGHESRRHFGAGCLKIPAVVRPSVVQDGAGTDVRSGDGIVRCVAYHDYRPRVLSDDEVAKVTFQVSGLEIAGTALGKAIDTIEVAGDSNSFHQWNQIPMRKHRQQRLGVATGSHRRQGLGCVGRQVRLVQGISVGVVENPIDFDPFLGRYFSTDQSVIEDLDRAGVVRAVSIEIDGDGIKPLESVVHRSNDDIKVVEQGPVPVPNDVHEPDPTTHPEADRPG